MCRTGWHPLFLIAAFISNFATARAAPPQAARPVAYIGARILSVAGTPIGKGVLLVEKGKITGVGPVGSVAVPDGAERVDLGGKTIIPGLVDTHSHVGIWPRPTVPAHQDGNEGSGPVQGSLRALDSVYPDDPGIRMAVAGGITTANIMPGSANVIGGQTVYVKYRGATVEAMRVSGPILGGLKMANGENPKNWNFGRNKVAPATRMKIAALQREQFVKAREYQRRWSAYRKDSAGGKNTARPDRDLALEPLVEVLEHKRTVHFHSHRADDIMTVLRLADEFGFEVVVQHGTEGYRVSDEIKKRNVPVSLTLIDSPGGKPEVAGLLEESAALLDKAGVLIAINTDDSITESRFFLRTGASAVRGGLSESAALRALTLNGAKMLHLDGRLGSLEKGKDADFVVLSGAPFSVYTAVLQTYIDGVKVFDRARQADWTYQAGGFALRDRTRLPKTPALVKAPRPAPEPGPDARFGAFKNAPRRFVVHAGRVYTVAKGVIEDGLVLIEDGKVKAVGKRGELIVPAATPELTAAAVTPGLIDAHTVVGLSGGVNVPADQDQDENTDPNQADLRVLDAFNPNESLLEFLRSQGVTVIHAVPGRHNVIAGQTGIFHTHGTTADSMSVRFPAGLLINLGEVAKATYPNKLPTTRMGTASLIRTAFTQAASHAAKKSAATSPDKRPAANAKLEALGLALDKKVPVIFAAHRADDLQTALRLAKEFDLKARLDLATEGYLMAAELAEAHVPVVLHPAMQRVSSMETLNSFLGNAAVLADHRVPLALGTGFEAYVPKTRVLRGEAAIALINGLGHDRALRAITLDAAKILDIADRYGSLEPGKVADLVLYDGDPFEHTTHVKMTIQEGRVVYDRAEYLKLPFERRALPLMGGGGVGCCLEGW